MLYRFRNSQDKPNLQSSISDHASFIVDNIYLTNYKNGSQRFLHGGPHASGTALSVVILVNLYRHFEYSESLNLTERQLFLLQITALLHDSARENDGVDMWDNESGENCYYYLTEVLEVEHDEARIYAEAIANKDTDTTHKFYELTISNSKQILWKERPSRKKNFFQNIIHDADCLEFLRIRPLAYDGRYLDFYKIVALKDKNALEMMGTIIAQYRSLLTILGYNSSITHSQKKSFYEIEPEIYLKIVQLIEALSNLGLLNRLFNKGALSHKKNLNQNWTEEQIYNLLIQKTQSGQSIYDDEELNKRFHKFELFFRGIAGPAKKNPQFNTSNAETELRFTFQTGGNPDRSVTMMARGIQTFFSIGYLVEKNCIFIQEASELDFGSGIGNKKAYQKKKRSSTYGNNTEAILEKIRFNSLLGGVKTHQHAFLKNFNEVIVTIFNFNAVVFNLDACTLDEHPYEIVLNAIYLQQLFENVDKEKRKLDIIEYSAAHSRLRMRQYSENDILNMWRVLSENYIKSQIKKNNFKVLLHSSEGIMAAALNSTPEEILITVYYSENLKSRLNEMIREMQEMLIDQYEDSLFVDIEKKPEIILTDRAQQIILKKNPLTESEKEIIKKNFGSLLQESIFLKQPITN